MVPLALAVSGLVASPAVGSVLIGSDLSATPNFAFLGAPATLVQTVAPASGVAAGGLTAPSDGVVVR